MNEIIRYKLRIEMADGETIELAREFAGDPSLGELIDWGHESRKHMDGEVLAMSVTSYNGEWVFKIWDKNER